MSEVKTSNIDFSKNSLNTIRLLAALQVFYGHAVYHMHLPQNHIFSSVFTIFQGVPVFFILSGFLIWKSIDRTPDTKKFAKKRILRLYPELWCAVILSILSIVTLYNGYAISELIPFSIGQSTILQFWTPNSLRGFGCGTPNGSLASIFMIIQFYIVAWVLKRNLKSHKWIIAFTLFGLATNVLSPVLGRILPAMVYKLYDVSLLPYLWLFMLGVIVCDKFDTLMPIMKKYWWIGAFLLVALSFLDIDIRGEYGVFKTILQCFTWLGFAYALPALNVKRDIFYGIFLYHMVIVNIFIEMGLIGSWLWFGLDVIIVIALSLLSNKYIGSLKNKI